MLTDRDRQDMRKRASGVPGSPSVLQLLEDFDLVQGQLAEARNDRAWFAKLAARREDQLIAHGISLDEK